MSENQCANFSWVKFYEQFADALRSYENKRPELIDHIQAIYEEIDCRLPTLDTKGRRLADIDPFTVFALFNRGIAEGTKKKLCDAFKRQFSIEADIPNDFDGIPIQNNMNTAFYEFSDRRPDGDIDRLWKLFNSGLELAEHEDSVEERDEFINAFDAAEKQKQVNWNLTFALFWTRPNFYLGLDGKNRSFLAREFPKLTIGKNIVPKGEKYLQLCQKFREQLKLSRYESIADFSHMAWLNSAKNAANPKIVKGGAEMNAQTIKLVNQLVGELEHSKNLVLTGAPGTGKTWVAREVAKQLAVEDGRIGFVQFHPSYDYTDFVEGLRPIDESGENGGGFERQDGIFKKFCAAALSGFAVDAIDNFEEAYERLIAKINDSASERIEVQNLSHKGTFPVSINERETGLASRTYAADGKEWIRGASKFFSKEQLHNVYKGMRGTCSGGHDCYRRAVIEYMKSNCGLKEYKAGRNASAEEMKKYVFIVDEINRGDVSKILGELFFAIDPGYRGKMGMVQTQYQAMVKDGAFCEGFYVPDNVYIIATMNDIDRSVESIDFAIRRRFRWHEIKPSDNAEMLNLLPKEFAKKARSTMDGINRWIDKEVDLGPAFEIGPAYFLKLNRELSLDKSFEDLWRYHIGPLLREYLRGQGELETKIESAHEAFGKTDGAN